MALSEIEKLERRYAENPQGLTFAPLAEIHRKNGEVQRALDLLKPGLALHPDYIPASIVLGRCHLDLGDVQAAEAAFLHVLSLDGENVIALKALADISERLLKFDDAERWLHTLLSVDRSNDEAREQLQRVEIAKRQAEVASSVEPDSVLEREASAETAEAAAASAADEKPAADDTPGDAPPAFEPPVAEPVMGWVEPSSPPIEDLEPSALRDSFGEPSGIQQDEPVRYEDEVEPLDGLVGREVDEPDATPGEFQVETSEDIVLRSSGGSEFQMPDASQELFAGSAGGQPAPFEEDAPLPSAESRSTPEAPEPERTSDPVPWYAATPEPAREAEAAYEPEPVREPEAVREPEPVREPEIVGWGERVEPVEPTPPPEPEPVMAAAEPAVPEPEPEPVTASAEPEPPAPVAESEPPAPVAAEPMASEPVAAEPVAAEAFASQPVGETTTSAPVVEPPDPTPVQPPPAAARRAWTAAETGGRPVRQMLQDILTARPPAQSAAPPVRQPTTGGAGAPTRPAADALSLSSVFGEEAPGTPPAVPSAGAGTGVSFDDFFGAPGAAPTQRTSRAPDPKSDDLDQFHAWLQNLKR